MSPGTEVATILASRKEMYGIVESDGWEDDLKSYNTKLSALTQSATDEKSNAWVLDSQAWCMIVLNIFCGHSEVRHLSRFQTEIQENHRIPPHSNQCKEKHHFRLGQTTFIEPFEKMCSRVPPVTCNNKKGTKNIHLLQHIHHNPTSNPPSSPNPLIPRDLFKMDFT